MSMKHTFDSPKAPSRVVILGAGGFLGRSLCKALKQAHIPCLPISSKDFDLTQESNATRLAECLSPDDTLIMLSAITPDKGRDINAFIKNLNMAQTVCAALKQRPVRHVIYLSSDAVYPQEIARVTEETPAAPSDLYGIMHRAREIMFQSSVLAENLAILRLTITYGYEDTHNSYGPNRFRRMAEKDQKITLFGAGEETRDHIFIDDVVNLIIAVAERQSVGLLNLATGKSHSFMEAAKLVSAGYSNAIEIIVTERKNAVTHRHYDITQTLKLFPQLHCISLEEGIRQVHHESHQKIPERV